MTHNPNAPTRADEAAAAEAGRTDSTGTEIRWQDVLTAEEYAVLRQGATERPFTGEYNNETATGMYQCRACGADLFPSDTKFASHCGWPSFYAPLAEDRVRYIRDTSMGMERIEVRCANCDSHMGHVFEGEGYDTPTDQRYCINSISLRLDTADAQG
ncbi:peptide-methionine (R)-S-oxide reductase MsrB [Brevibacterium renqingii]|uniref:peptide-methionine (R)-S-oxide reductase MsrB n=1 Tax=Brevibacterium renqingii TaxID=2776916 RepID=UPI001ADFD20E|nr:peptide-methionine (R)-S-oxide reductase MsrB [Brevibacterium renqingii]